MILKNGNAKFTFLYLLSLIGLIFTALGVGMILFQIVNKNIADVIRDYSGQYSSSELNFGLSALVVAAPLYFFISYQIFKSLFLGDLGKDSAVRRWLTYFILLVSSTVMIGWFISIINSFLSGELTLKFILKSVIAIGIAALIFSFYLYDIRREETKGVKDKLIRAYFQGTLVLVAAVFVAGIFFAESPREARLRRFDNQMLDNFISIEDAVDIYYAKNKKIPQNLKELYDLNLITIDKLKNPLNGENIEYRTVGNNQYELCSDFSLSNKDRQGEFYWGDRWLHDAGHQCFQL